MIVAIPIWQQRVSPVLDVAGHVLLVDLEQDVEQSRRVETLVEQQPEKRLERLRELGVGTLVCGAVSRPLEEMLVGGGIKVIPRICGEVEEVLQAYRSGQLQSGQFAMPGCCGRRQGRHRGRCGRGRRFGSE